MRGSFTVLVVATIALVLSAYITGGFSLVREGFLNSINTFLRALPLLLAAFFMIGQIQVLVSGDTINKFLQRFSGFKGVILGALAGGLFPGPPYVYYPFLCSFKGGKLPFYLFFSFLSGKHVYDFARIPMEIGLINPGIALLRNVITLPVPIMMGLLSRYIVPGKMDRFFENKGEE